MNNPTMSIHTINVILNGVKNLFLFKVSVSSMQYAVKQCAVEV